MDDRIYNSWETYPSSRLLLGTHSQECIWVRILPDGTMGLDNDPLWTKYRYQDIIEPKDGEPTIIYRRWNSKIWFWYEPTSGDVGPREKKIHGLLKSYGSVTLQKPGAGFVLLKEDDGEALVIIEALLAPLDYVEGIEIGGDMPRFEVN